MNDFNRLAPVYDKLANIVFGKAIRRAQTRFLNEIDGEATVLILGGGTGWLLSELVAAKPDCSVTYIDASKKMIEMTEEKVKDIKHRVIFIHGTERDIPPESTFEVVITHFFLDLFDMPSCKEVCKLINSHCRPGSLWLACDFVNQTWWHGAMLRIMYIFFGWAASLRNKRLPDWQTCIQELGYSEFGVQYYFGNLICSAFFQISRNRE